MIRRGLLSRRIKIASIAAILLAVFIVAASRGSFAGRETPVAEKLAGLPERIGITVPALSPSKVDYARLDRRLQYLAGQDNMVGLAVGVVENGRIRFLKGYGTTIAGGDEPVTVDTVFRWASLSKGVAADMVAKLAEEEKLSLQDPVARWSASLRLPGGNEQRATVANILSHQLGLFGHAHDSSLEDGRDDAELRASLGSLNAICPPGQCHAYQNVAYDAASEVVEKATGTTYQQAVREQLFLPLGMRSATLTRDGLVQADSWARPHRGGKNSKPVEVTDSYYRVPAAGGVNSSIKDLTIWMLAQMGRDPDVLPRDVLETVQRPRVGTPGEKARMREFAERLKQADYGLGWRVYDYAGHTLVGHRGGVTGYRSLILFDPEKKSGVVALWNSGTAQPGGLEFEVMDMVYELEPRDWLELNELDDDSEQAFSGTS
jgi:beta-lactamase class C